MILCLIFGKSIYFGGGHLGNPQYSQRVVFFFCLVAQELELGIMPPELEALRPRPREGLKEAGQGQQGMLLRWEWLWKKGSQPGDL